MIDELHVDGGDCHEHAEGVRGNLCAECREIEFGHGVHRGPCPQRAAEYIDDPMHMMQRQK